MKQPEQGLYFHHKEGNPTDIVTFAGREVLVEVVGKQRKVVGFIYTDPKEHPRYFYRMARADEDASPVTCFDSITDGRHRRELTDKLKEGGAQSVEF